MTDSISFHGWRFRIDSERTRAAYSASKSRGAEDCSCLCCQNLIAQRDLEYPSELREFLYAVGVDPHKEAEVWEAGPLEDGYSYNAGWWHFIGELETEGEGQIALASEPLGRAKEWTIAFIPGDDGLKLETLPSSPLVAVNFGANLPWVLRQRYPG